MFGMQAELYQSDIRPLWGGRCADLGDVGLAGDHPVAEPGHDLGEQLQPVALLVRDVAAPEGRVWAEPAAGGSFAPGGTSR
jgi:hypothetical protein